MGEQYSTLVELVRKRALETPDKTCFIYLRDGSSDEQKLTYGELDRVARSIAVELSTRAGPGDCALINHNPGFDYISTFLGCLYAGIMAIPVYPPRYNQKLDRVHAIVKEARPKLCLSSKSILEAIAPQLKEDPLLRHLPWIESDNIEDKSSEWKMPDITEESLAFLQYTSGTTAQPKGIMLSHGNLVDNLVRIADSFQVHNGYMSLSWLPPYHDMGLIGGILEPIYCGFPVVLMSPFTFLMRPYRWLAAMTKYKVSFSGAPNFAYDLCTKRVTEKQMADLDLSNWELAYCGAEPVRADTLERFAQKFGAVGFKREAFFPCYGLAESTLIVTGAQRGKGATIAHFDRDLLEKKGTAKAVPVDAPGSKTLVSSGRAVGNHDVCIVDPQTSESQPEGKTGEIWVSGPSVALGYWKRSVATASCFEVPLKGTHKRFLRTGDLGFKLGEELFVTGRIKDLVIVRGRNLYPQDIERTVEKSHPCLKQGSGAAVSVEWSGEEQLVIIQEVDRKGAKGMDLNEVIQVIYDNVIEEHGIKPVAISLIKPNSIPLTSSGKIKRQASKKQFLKGELFELESFSTGTADL